MLTSVCALSTADLGETTSFFKPLLAIRLQIIGGNAFKGNQKATLWIEQIYLLSSYNSSNNCTAISAIGPKVSPLLPVL